MNKEEIKALQKTLNALGASLKVDGHRGPLTIAAEKKYLNPKTIEPVPAPSAKGYFGAPWIGANLDLLGRHESDKALNARYVPEWKLEGLPSYTTLVGNTRAWCSVKVNADFRKVGVKGTNSAGAASWSRYGVKCPFWFGCVLDIKHGPKGGRHVAFFLYWIDEAKGICAVYGGNQGQKMSIVSQSINRGKDFCVAGPRGPIGWEGQFVSKADVLKAYPELKVGGSAGSTR